MNQLKDPLQDPELSAENTVTDVRLDPPQDSYNVRAKRKKSLLLLGTAVLLIIAVVAVLLFVWQGRDDQSTGGREGRQNSNSRQYKEDAPAYAKLPNISERAGQQDVVSLLLNGEIVLERFAVDWANGLIAQWEDWIFFGAYDEVKNQGLQTRSFDIYAYKLTSGQYAHIGEVAAHNDIAQIKGVEVLADDHLYITLEAYASSTRVYRCQLDTEKGCAGVNEFYFDDNSRLSTSVHYAAGQYYLEKFFGDAGADMWVVYAYDPETKRETKIIETSRYLNNGEYVVTISGNGLIWVGETKSDSENEEDYGQLVRLYAVDRSGRVIKTINAENIPISSAIGVVMGLSSNTLQIYSYDKRVVFDVQNGSFGDIEDYDFMADREASRVYEGPQLSDIQEKFSLPGGYEFAKYSW